MKSFWQHYFIVIVIALIAAVIWVIFGSHQALIFLSISLFFLLMDHMRHLAVLDRWLQTPNLAESTMPNGTGVWDDIFMRFARYVRRHSHSQQRLSLALERIQSATAAMPDGIVILDDKDRIEWCNPVAERHLGIDLNMDEGQLIIHLVRQLQFVKYLASHDYSAPLVLKQMHHHQLVIFLQLVPYGDKQKLLISRDITRFEKIEVMRRDFIANVSHELRTPLTVIGGFLETLSEDIGNNTEMDKRALELMTEQTVRMQHLIEDLLTLSRLENAQNIMTKEPVDMAAMLHKLSQEAQSLSKENHNIGINIDSDLQLLGSEDELHSAFGNLVSNAVRYTPKGGSITLNWVLHEGQGVFFVQDSGIGIESRHIARLTERFYRVDSSRSRETGGTGLGLAIVKHVLTRHQARLEITSEMGKGSCFKIWFPEKCLLQRVEQK